MPNRVTKAVTIILIIAFLLATITMPSFDGWHESSSAGEFTGMPDSILGMLAMLTSNSRMLVDIGILSVILVAMLASFDGIKCIIISIYSKCGEIGMEKSDSLLRRICLLQI
jgi:hypothetical protein